MSIFPQPKTKKEIEQERQRTEQLRKETEEMESMLLRMHAVSGQNNQPAKASIGSARQTAPKNKPSMSENVPSANNAELQITGVGGVRVTSATGERKVTSARYSQVQSQYKQGSAQISKQKQPIAQVKPIQQPLPNLQSEYANLYKQTLNKIDAKQKSLEPAADPVVMRFVQQAEQAMARVGAGAEQQTDKNSGNQQVNVAAEPEQNDNCGFECAPAKPPRLPQSQQPAHKDEDIFENEGPNECGCGGDAPIVFEPQIERPTFTTEQKISAVVGKINQQQDDAGISPEPQTRTYMEQVGTQIILNTLLTQAQAAALDPETRRRELIQQILDEEKGEDDEAITVDELILELEGKK